MNKKNFVTDLYFYDSVPFYFELVAMQFLTFPEFG